MRIDKMSPKEMVDFLRDHASRLPKRNGPLSVSPEIMEVAEYIENIYMPEKDDSAKCEECGHDDFYSVQLAAGDPEPGYKCKKCGHLHYI